MVIELPFLTAERNLQRKQPVDETRLITPVIHVKNVEGVNRFLQVRDVLVWKHASSFAVDLKPNTNKKMSNESRI